MDQAQPDGPNPDYKPGPVEYVRGPNVYHTINDALIGMINRLEEENHHNRYMIGTMIAKPDQQVADVRAKNTNLEERNNALRQWAKDLNAANTELHARLDGANAKVANLMRINQELEERINNQASSIDDLLKKKASSLKVEHIFRVPDHDFGFGEFVQETNRWEKDTFSGAATDQDCAMALIEEAIEVGQLYGIKADAIVAKAVSVMNKPPGVLIQELGGVAITLAGLIARSPLEPRGVLVAALNDCWARQDEIRMKKGIVRAVGKGKMVPGALDRLREQGINITATEGGPVNVASAIVDERKAYGDPFMAAEAEMQEKLKAHIAEARDPHTGKA